MFTKEFALLGTVLCVLLPPLFQGINGRTSYDLAPIFRYINKPSERDSPPSATITGSQQTTGSVSGFVNSTAEGNGEPNSAVAYAWQGGQTSAYGAQTATADNSSSTTQTTGFSTCLQGYQGTAGGANSTFANSVANVLCNTTYNQSGQHVVNREEMKQFGRGNGRPQLPGFPQHGAMGPGSHVPPRTPTRTPSHMPPHASPHMSPHASPHMSPHVSPHVPHVPPQPQVVTLNNTIGQIGEAQSGQSHSSISQAGGPIGGHLNILASGFANMPQAQVNFQQSTMDSFGKPIETLQDWFTAPGLQSEEQTLMDVSGGQVAHNSGGLAYVHGLGNIFNITHNSHAQEEKGGDVAVLLID